jgi:hypothetical protein
VTGLSLTGAPHSKQRGSGYLIKKSGCSLKIQPVVDVMSGNQITRRVSMALFSTHGELNASSVKDALSTLVKYAAILEENQPSNLALAGQPDLDDTKRDEMIARAILTQDGKIAMAQAINCCGR